MAVFGSSAAMSEWRTHGLMVAAAAVGMSFHSVMSYSLGLFMQPLEQEFGWSRAQMSVGLAIAAFMSLPLSPVVGAMIDRWGSRRLAIIGVIGSAAAIAAFSLNNGSTIQWLTLWIVYALVGLLIKATVWSAAVASVFSAGRGLALAAALSGTAIAQILVPPITQVLIESHGWRAAYVVLAVGWGSISLVLLIFFFFDARDPSRRTKAAAQIASAMLPDGIGFKEAFRSMTLIRIALATLLATLLYVAIIIHQVPILTERGVSRETAASLASLAGVAGIVGKVVTGWLVDRWDGGWVGGVSLAVPSVGFAILLFDPINSLPLTITAMIIIGYAAGTSLQVTAYLTSRYAGLRNFGKIFGVMASLMAVGGGAGPMLAGWIHDSSGSYDILLGIGIPVSILIGLLVVRLGAYPAWTPAPARIARDQD